MSSINIEIHVVPADEDLNNIVGCDKSRIGKVFSNSKELKVVKNNIGYSILFYDEEFVKIDAKSLFNNIIKLISSNLPDNIVTVSIEYHYLYINDNKYYAFDNETAEHIMKLNNEFLTNDLNGFIMYEVNESIIEIVKELKDEPKYIPLIRPTAQYFNRLRDQSSSSYDYDKDDEDSDDGDNYLPQSQSVVESGAEYINRLIAESYTQDDEDDDEDEEDDKPRKKPKKDIYYGTSRVIRAIDNPKKYYRRHGVLVCKKKDALKKDEKTIKAFLKSFIPGNATWKKEFRDDLLERWMNMYAISSKELKELEKKHKKKRRKKNKYSVNTDAVLDVTKRIFTVPDKWNDPNR